MRGAVGGSGVGAGGCGHPGTLAAPADEPAHRAPTPVPPAPTSHPSVIKEVATSLITEGWEGDEAQGGPGAGWAGGTAGG